MPQSPQRARTAQADPFSRRYIPYPRLTASERRTLAARRLLGDKRVVAFLRTAAAGQAPTWGIRALQMAIAELKQGGTPRTLFWPWRGYPADGSGFFLQARRTGTDAFRIEFGCEAGPTAGDGGEWDVIFDARHRVRRIDLVSAWVS